MRNVDGRRGALLYDREIERLTGVRPRVSLDGIVGHPRLPHARKLYLDSFLAVYGDDPFLVRLLIESGRFFVFLIAMLIEAGHDPGRRETWPTIGLLKRTMTAFGLASGRHVDHLIARLCAVGYMQSKPAAQDKRVRVLTPSEKMRAHDRAWMAAHYAPLTALFPQHDYGLAVRRDPTFHAVYRRTTTALLPIGAKLYMSEPDMLLFLDRAGGYMVIAALLKAAMEAPDPAHAAVPYADAGDRFGISRTHVRKLLVAAEDAGLVKLHARGGHRVEILPRLWTSHDRGIAGGMYLNDVAYLMTTRQMTVDG